ncbi:MAG: hypothetical protein AAFV53_28830 [Myxococcota bacterium]
MDEYDDIDWLAATWEIKAASLLAVLAGLLRAAVGFQLLFLVRLVGAWWWVPYAMLILGGLTFVVGAISGRGRRWANLLNVFLIGVLLAGGVFWEIYAVSHGLMSLLSVLSVLAALPALIMAGISIPPALRVHDARKRLLE